MNVALTEEEEELVVSKEHDDLYSEEAEALLEAFSSISSIDKAWCRSSPVGKGSLDIMVGMSQRNLPANSMRKFVSTAHVPDPQGDLSQFHWAPFPLELSGGAIMVPSPSGQRMIIIRNGDGANKDTPPPVKLEVWGAGRLLKETTVSPTLHGSVFSDGWFEGVSWSGDESQVAYIAEEPSIARPVFGRKKNSAGAVANGSRVPGESAEKSQQDAGSWKGRGAWTEDWGERYTGKGRPCLYVFDIPRDSVQRVEGIPADVSAGQVVWGPPVSSQLRTLVFVGWQAYSANFGTHKRLGMVYCQNRPSALYAVPAPSFSGQPATSASAVKLTASLSSALSPRFSPDGSLLVFLSAHAAVDSGVHAATNSLHSLPWPAAGLPSLTQGLQASATAAPLPPPELNLPIQSIIDIVPRAEEVGGFPGLYCAALIAQPWLADSRTLLLTTAWRSTHAIIAVHVESGRVSRLTPEGPISWSLLDVRNNVVVAGASTPACPTKLMLGRINAGWLKAEGWLWSEISPPHVEYNEEVEVALKSMEFEVLQVPVISRGAPLAEGAKQPFEAIFVRRQPPPGKAGPPSPLLVVPHGGPHGVTATSFIMPYAYLCSLGYSILHVNYRGSTGFGEEALQSLPRQIGRQDVADVLAALDKAITVGYADASQVAVIGGSHGGFLAAHLIGQAPERFCTAVMRNPVTNLATMVGISDIPDWCFVEVLGPPGVPAYSDAPSATEVQAFHRASPITHATKVKAPTLFLLGAQDRRVPVSNGLQFHLALKGQGLETRAIVFPEDNHAIDKPQSEFEQWVSIAGWLKKHLPMA